MSEIEIINVPVANVRDSVQDERDQDIGVANRENVQRMLSSLAIYPFTERLE